MRLWWSRDFDWHAERPNALASCNGHCHPNQMATARATVIAVTAFAPIGLSEDATGEYCGTLFTVLLISLMLSWFTAISLTPFFADLFFRGQKAPASGEESDPYQGFIFVVYRRFLEFCMRRAWLTMGVLVLGLAASLYGFTKVKQAFFHHRLPLCLWSMFGCLKGRIFERRMPFY